MTRILLVHGLGAEPDAFDTLLDPVRAAVPDARITVPRLSDRFADAVDVAAAWLADGPGVAVGHSMGGHVVLRAARRVGAGHPLVLLAPGGLGPAPRPELVWAIWSADVLRRRSADDFERAMRGLYADRGHPLATRRAGSHRALVGSPGLDGWIERVVGQVTGALEAWVGDAADTPGRLWIVRGARDPMVLEPPLRDLAARHDDARFERWDGVGHMVPDEAPDRVATLVAEAAATLEGGA